ncbi:spore gernimation protein GerPD [Paenibacillus rigui]|uniref:Spore gernimation protein GerPD n=1 Tax=Paenibacillus rigui TaxID=554312 RepID=A0A229UTP9_9BACL|nr:spore gernimation protein GerPD [Paenibacillus rigui]OXM86997.1 spore gernimation protein GerPD [Paenibacillus rigui]
MEFNVINGGIEVGKIDITYLSTSSTFMIGDICSVSLMSAYETPPENMIVGVTIPFIE